MPARLHFTDADMHAFAHASGDHSPLHTDAEFGRRTVFGAPIVYGALETIALLGRLPEAAQARLRGVRSVFAGPVLIGEDCSVSAQERPGGWELLLRGRGRVLARVSAYTAGPTAAAAQAVVPELAAGDGADLEAGVPRVGVRAEGPYRPGPELGELAARLGAGGLPAAVLDAIAWASHAVGAGIPGFHGLCAGVSVEVAQDAGEADSQWLAVTGYDERSDRVLIEGGVRDAAGAVRARGRVECFPFAPTPVSAPVAPVGGDGARGIVVVVGASRGAGAALTLALLAHGYAVHGIYARSPRAAAELQALAGPDAALTLHRADGADRVALAQVASAIEGSLEGLVLCAAPAALPMTLTPDSAEALSAHVQATLALAAVPVAVFGPRLARDGAWLIGLSAGAVTAPVRELPQLTAAKAALEGLLRAVAPTLPGVAVLAARVPAMATDRANTPGARRRAVAPGRVAQELVARVAAGGLPAGLSVIEPGVAVAEVGMARR